MKYTAKLVILTRTRHNYSKVGSSTLNSIKPHLLLLTGDFNVRSCSRWASDADIIEGTRQ